MGAVLNFNNPLTALIFDLDGTLIDSVPQVMWTINQVFAEEGLELLDIDEVTAVVGGGVRAMFQKTLEHRRGSANDYIDALIERYMAVYLKDPGAHTIVYDGVHDVLQSLAQNEVKMGICTNKPSKTTRAVLRAVGLEKYFGAVVAADDVAYLKPDGRHIQATLSAVRCDKKRAVMIGDSETDVLAGRSAGLATVLVTYGYCHVPFTELGADVLIDTFNKLPAALSTLAET